MIYFDNAATGGRKPDTVLSAVSSAIRVCANPGRSGHKLSLTAAKMVESCRKTLCSFFDGYAYDRVVFTKYIVANTKGIIFNKNNSIL